MSDWDDLVPPLVTGWVIGLYAFGIWSIVEELIAGTLPL